MIGILWMVTAVQTGWVVRTPVYTVGDTIVVERFVGLPSPAVRLRVSPLERNDDIEPLRPPAVTYEADGARIRYVIAAFTPNAVQVTLPDFDLVYPDGRVEAVTGGEVVLSPRSVLPVGGPDSTPAPRWSRAPIARQTVRYEPALAFGALSLVVLAGWGIARRRVRSRPRWSSAPLAEAEAPIMEWVSAGEPRAVAALAAARLRRQIARLVPEASEALSASECMNVLTEGRPGWPLEEIRDVLSGLDRASFAPAVPSDVLVLVDDVSDLMNSIESAESAHATDTVVSGAPAE